MAYKVLKLTPKLHTYIREVAGTRFGHDLSTTQLIYLMTRHVKQCKQRYS